MLDNLGWGTECGEFPITPPRLIYDLRRSIPEDGILCLDNGLYKVCHISSSDHLKLLAFEWQDNRATLVAVLGQKEGHLFTIYCSSLVA
jgi:hypothetical protein